MKFTKNFLLGGVLMLAAFTASAQLAETPFNGSFLAGNNLAITAGVTATTNTYAGTNTWIKGGISITNGYSLTPILGSQIITNTAAFSDVGLWYDRDGSFPAAAIGVVASGQTSIATNILTFRFAAIEGGFPVTAINTWAFQVTLNGTNTVALITNFPTATFQGVHRVRCTAVESSNSGTNATLNYLEFKGFKP